jgi:hypothetical protein
MTHCDWIHKTVKPRHFISTAAAAPRNLCCCMDLRCLTPRQGIGLRHRSWVSRLCMADGLTHRCWLACGPRVKNHNWYAWLPKLFSNFCITYVINKRGPGLLSQRHAAGWTVRGLNPGEGEIFRTRPDWPWRPPRLLYNERRVIPGGKAAGAWR